MGTTHLPLQFPRSATSPSSPQPLPILLTKNPRILNITSRRSTVYGGRHVGEKRFRFNLNDEFVTGDEDDGFGAKKRVWWSDDSIDIDDDDDEEGFGVFGESIDASWVFKGYVFTIRDSMIWCHMFTIKGYKVDLLNIKFEVQVLNAIGWMLPAIIISLLLGTGPNTFFMALVLPIAQSAVSLVTDTFWGRSSGSPKPKRRTKKKKPFARAESDIRMNGENENTESGSIRENYARPTCDTGTNRGDEDAESGNVRENYQSWVAANDISTKTRDKRAPGFGGWDELDKRMGSYKIPKSAQRVNKPQQQKKGKLSRRVRNRDTPLLLRLIIAVFPFLGSWTKLL
ncbi:hypothetical protein TEA_003397 [Camellia sinensis var. sinensis]|uniref:Uncharacterized protein n=1 Tax=Camellia sinensis var. sinensis TaxID=542762 RepID=A0A4S4DAI0_CAMSN|nr:hypothetical protein TEA_003397 [Camellia sinensis var. sinensis]